MLIRCSASKYYAFSSSHLSTTRKFIQCENKPANLAILQDKISVERFAAVDVKRPRVADLSRGVL